MLPMDPGRGSMTIGDRIAYLTQDKFFLDAYPLKVRGGSDEHDRNMLASACSFAIASHRRGEVVHGLPALESDVAAFLSGGAAMRRRNKQARDFQRNAQREAAERLSRNLAAAYHPHREDTP